MALQRAAAASATPPPPPLLPWLALCDGTFLSLPDGAVHHLPVADNVSSRVSNGSALFLVHGDDDKCSVMNPSPMMTTLVRLSPRPPAGSEKTRPSKMS
ncbi:hypothetical protein D1007_16233 [Hordeum vulgare]|nr:hypothetical protein D1007_16233 [Hordeum vulgare]